MYNSIDYGASESYFGLLFGMAWVAILMLAVTVSAVQNRRERMRIGIEVEALRNGHSEHATNHSIATYLALERQRLGDKAFEKYWNNYRQLKQSVFKTRAKRREESRKALPVQYLQKYYEIQREGWSQGNTSYYTKVTTDGSLTDGAGGLEVVSHPLLDGQHHGWIAHVVQALRYITRIDRSCGLHIHVGLRDPDARFGDEGQITQEEAKAIAGRCAWAYAYFTPVFNQFVSESRHNGQYCRTARHMLERFPNNQFKQTKRLSHHTMNPNDALPNQVAEPIDDDDMSQGFMIYTVDKTDGQELWEDMYRHNTDHGRYYHCNTGSLIRRNFGTVEYRQHQGTVNPTKIRNWVQLMYDFTMRCANETDFNAIKSYEVTREGLWAFLDYASDEIVRDYYEKRAIVLRGSQLIRACTACGSHTCVHEECVSSESPSNYSLSSLESRRTDAQCMSCDTYVEIDSAGDAWCDYCESEVAYHTGLLASVALGLLITAPVIGAVALLVGCGIGAIHSGTKRFRYGPLSVVGRLGKLWSGLSSRGGQAAGIAWQNRDSNSVEVFKAPKSSTVLSRFIKKYIGRKTCYAFLHTRFATHGKNNADNAHPHTGPEGYVTMVHNGVVHNHASVWKALGIKPTGPVDSQAVAACLEIGGIEKVVEHCEGSMSLIWTDSRDPIGTLKYWTNGGNPLAAGRLDHPNTGPLVIASTEAHIEEAMGGLATEEKKSRLKTLWSCVIGREYTVTPNGLITHRDIKGSEDTAGFVYDWRTYKGIKSNKKRTIKVPIKAPASGDTCTVNGKRPTSLSYNYDDIVLNEALNDAWFEMKQIGEDAGWPADRHYHGYKVGTVSDGHKGIRPDGSTYGLPATDAWGTTLEPMDDVDQMIEVLTGHYDPRYNYHEDSFIMDAIEPYGDYRDHPALDAYGYSLDERWY
tara:strand:- start:829 stop:3588 length:2760 start_codon:yes stop_codon:yes gene_type:complete